MVKNSDHSFSPQLLEISFATKPSQRTVGETWIPFCLLNLTEGTPDVSGCSSVSNIRGLTGVFQIISDVNTAIGAGLVRQEVSHGSNLVTANDFPSEVGEFLPDLDWRQVGSGDVKEIALSLEQL